MGASSPCGNGAYLVLLRVGFTELPRSLGVLVSPYLTFSPLPRGIGSAAIPRDGIFSVALSLFPNSALQNSGTVRVTDHPALRSSDFPPLLISCVASSQEERPSVSLRPPSFLEISESTSNSMIALIIFCNLFNQESSSNSLSFLPRHPPLDGLICQTVRLFILLPRDGPDLKG
jgi:hypothetical protein